MIFKLLWHRKSNYISIRTMNLCFVENWYSEWRMLSQLAELIGTTQPLAYFKKDRKKKIKFYFPFSVFQISSLCLCLCYCAPVCSLHCKNTAYQSWRCGSSSWFIIWQHEMYPLSQKRRKEHTYRQHTWLPSSTEEFRMNVSIGAGLILESKLTKRRYNCECSEIRYSCIPWAPFFGGLSLRP